MDFLRGPDDARVEQIAHLDRLRAYDARSAPTTGDCPRCGTTETVMFGDRCHQCDDAAAWSRDNRHLCNLVHRPAAP